ncbi:very short patch repair endonuclease [Niastella yeongjuensis]|uniref:Very short patch repair endonuclease n=1 Tax=Niastella yeongjuensis TaxID=354355 RepID=A0A1V9EDR6_9BACT|nr:DNA mismatch endonuclease Vsr [Niastella yeongjuensis]OQP44232.1 very short patch repair endonuclease [Niastella yeongjuensis]SEO40455.1 T/G mismatch-specific endonuclease [Niastella yeongjuensis]
MDIWSKVKRSEVMGKIRAKDTKPEMLLRSALFKAGYRFRIHKAGLPGKPDIVMSKYKTIIFVHGCFWHFHEDCAEGRIPNSNSEYWRKKLTKNIERDSKNIKLLQDDGWQVLVVWECELKSESSILKIVDKLRMHLKI